MKRLIITMALGAFLFGFNTTNAQVSADINVNIGTPGSNDGFYYGGTYDYPDSYYSDYPEDYYPQPYYQDNYNDYYNSIADVNWNNLFVQLRLSSGQINAILTLNRRFPSFAVWNTFYRVNPSRWYYDRFYTLQQILSPSQFVFFYNRYYGGVRPVVYFSNYQRTHYAPRFQPMPRYRNVNVAQFHRTPWGASGHSYGRAIENGRRNNFANYGRNNNRGNYSQNRQNQNRGNSPFNRAPKGNQQNWGQNRQNQNQNRGNSSFNRAPKGNQQNWSQNRPSQNRQQWNKERGNQAQPQERRNNQQRQNQQRWTQQRENKQVNQKNNSWAKNNGRNRSFKNKENSKSHERFADHKR